MQRHEYAIFDVDTRAIRVIGSVGSGSHDIQFKMMPRTAKIRNVLEELFVWLDENNLPEIMATCLTTLERIDEVC